MAEQEKEYPGVHAAFQFVIPSYQWAISRVEAVDSRIQTLQVFILTFTFGVPAIVSRFSDIAFGSFWFIAGVLAATLAVALGVIARSSGALTLPSPTTIFQRWLDLEDWTFRKDAVFFAGKHFDANVKLIKTKADIVTAMTILFFVEGVSLFLWVISSCRQ